MKSYSEIILALKQPFPKGTVQNLNTLRPYIPVQAYMKRLEDCAAEQWHWRIIDEPVIDMQEGFVIVKGELIIAGAIRQGLGTATFKKNDVSKLKSMLATAESESFRDACDKFLMGWIDLAPYRDWGQSPAIRFDNIQQGTSSSEQIPASITSSLPPSNRKCTRCQQQLTGEDELALNLYGAKLPYCAAHIPQQFKIKK